MKETGILYSAEMVRADLDHRKSVTRRVINRLLTFGPITEFGPCAMKGYDWHFRDKRMRWHEISHERLLECCPYGGPGDEIWVREMLREVRGKWFYAADEAPVMVAEADELAMVTWCHHKEQSYCSSMFMPRFACRITHTLKSVRPERLHDITEEDAIAEGVSLEPIRKLLRYSGPTLRHIDVFAGLWDVLNEKRGYPWSGNWWVWPLGYDPLEGLA